MNFPLPLFYPANAEIVMLSLISVTLVAELFLTKRYREITYYLTQATLLIVIGFTFAQIGHPSEITFSGLFISDDVARLLKLFIELSAFIAFVYSREYIESANIPSGEFYILGLFSTLGMMVLVSAYSLLTIYLGLELLSLPLYAMVALRRDNAKASEAAMKYFVMGAMASGMLLYGMSMLYGATGTLLLDQIASQLNTNMQSTHLLLTFALVFMVAGIGFKLAAAPFHMWAPDVYTGAPTATTLFLSSAPKVAALGMAFRVLVFALPNLSLVWHKLIVVLAVLSIAIGNMLAITQTNIKRMLAYSAIAHIGYMLLGLAAGTSSGYAYSLFYICAYALMSVAAFGMVVLLSRSGFEAENIEDFRGLNSRNPWLALIMLIVMFSMAGIPPAVGFFAKFLVLKALVDTDQVGLATYGVLFAVIGAFYYLRIVKTMYFDAPEEKSLITLSADRQLVITLNGFALLALGLFPTALITACRVAFGLS